MKMKYLVIVSLILAILTIGAVSASQDGDTLAVDEDASVDEVTSVSVDDDDAVGEEGSDGPEPGSGTWIDVHYDEYNKEEIDSETVFFDVEDDINQKVNGTVEINITKDGSNVCTYKKDIDVETNYYQITLDDLDGFTPDYGTYVAKMKYAPVAGDSVEKTAEFNVTYLISIDGVDEEGDAWYVFYHDENFKLEFTVPAQLNKDKLTVKINNRTISLSDDNSKIDGSYKTYYYDVKAGDYGLGSYNVTLNVSGDSSFPNKSEEWEFLIIPKFVISDNKVYDMYQECYSVNERIFVKMLTPSNAGGQLKIYKAIKTDESPDDDPEYVPGDCLFTKDVTGNVTKVELTGLDSEVNKLLAVYEKEGFAYDYFLLVEFKQNSVAMNVSVDPLTIDEGNSTKIKIVAPKTYVEDGSTYEYYYEEGFAGVYVDDEFVQSLDISNYTAEYDLTKLAAGNHKISFKYSYYDNFFYKAFNVTVNSNSKPTNTSDKTPASDSNKKADKVTLTLKKVKVKKSAKKLVLTATLKINKKAKKGLKVIFKFNGKKYVAKTNKKGVAKVTIKKKVLKKLKVGKKIKIQASYGKTVKKLTVKVKK